MPSSCEEEDPKRSGYFAFFSASHFLFLLSSSSKFQFEFEGSVEGATSVILEGQYRAPCPCSLHVIQIICAAMVETLGVGNENCLIYSGCHIWLRGPTRGRDISCSKTRVRTLKHVAKRGARALKTHFSYWPLQDSRQNFRTKFRGDVSPAVV